MIGQPRRPEQDQHAGAGWRRKPGARQTHHGTTDEGGLPGGHARQFRRPKITSFYKNMTGDRNAVTLDSWMAKAILGEGVRAG